MELDGLMTLHTQNPNPPVSCVASYNHGKRVLRSWLGPGRVMRLGTNEFRFLLLADLTKFIHTDSSKHYFCSSYNCILCYDCTVMTTSAVILEKIDGDEYISRHNRLQELNLSVNQSIYISGLPRSMPNADQCRSKFWH